MGVTVSITTVPGPKDQPDPIRDGWSSSPYANAAVVYHRAGWLAPLPVDIGHGRAPVPTGFTGARNHDAYPPDVEQLRRWSITHAHANVGLWLPHDVIGIDVDAYGDKHGDETIKNVASIAGEPLPPTWTSTCRGPGPSRIHFMRVDLHKTERLRWRTGLSAYGGGVDIIRFGHMFARVWPSRKLDREPRGATYRWFDPSGHVVSHGRVPRPDELTQLPDSWLRALTVTGSSGVGEGFDLGYGEPLDDEAAETWVDRTHDALKEPCAVLRAVTDACVAELHAGGSRHDTLKLATWRALLLAGEEGHRGVKTALDEMLTAFTHVTVEGDGSRTWDVAVAEWLRLVTGAVSRIITAYPTPDTRVGCRCAEQARVGAWLTGATVRNYPSGRTASDDRGSTVVIPAGVTRRVGRVTISGDGSREDRA